MVILAVNQSIPIKQNASFVSKQHTALAKRTPEGNIEITGIGYYSDEVTLTAQDLEHLGFTPSHKEAP